MSHESEDRILHFDLNPTHVMVPGTTLVSQIVKLNKNNLGVYLLQFHLRTLANGRKPVVIDWDGAFAGNLTES